MILWNATCYYLTTMNLLSLRLCFLCPDSRFTDPRTNSQEQIIQTLYFEFFVVYCGFLSPPYFFERRTHGYTDTYSHHFCFWCSQGEHSISVMPTTELFVVDSAGVSRKISKLSVSVWFYRCKYKQVNVRSRQHGSSAMFVCWRDSSRSDCMLAWW